jgi:hypothetical protein
VSSEDRCATCRQALDAERYARCDVCGGSRLCIDCAKAHLCTERCRSNGCVAGLCVRIVRSGVADQGFGVSE